MPENGLRHKTAARRHAAVPPASFGDAEFLT
jgi:hypothetical protein